MYQGEKPQGPTTVTEMLEADAFCMRHVQQRTYPKEIKELSRKDTGKKTFQVDIYSAIRSLRPMLVDDILTVGVRPSYANPELINTRPMILPRGHPLSLLIIRREQYVAEYEEFCLFDVYNKPVYINGMMKMKYELGIPGPYDHAIKLILSQTE